MMRGRSWVWLVVALAVVPAASERALAQAGAFGWSPDEARLTNEDNRLLWQSTDALNAMASPAAGETRSWSNPASGTSGKVTLVRLFESNGMPCHALHYAISFPTQPVPQGYDFTWCRAANGQWKIAS